MLHIGKLNLEYFSFLEEYFNNFLLTLIIEKLKNKKIAINKINERWLETEKTKKTKNIK